MRSLKALMMILVLASLAACSDFRATPSSQAYQDYTSDTHLSTSNAQSYDHGW